jgi:hypothetical protein
MATVRNMVSMKDIFFLSKWENDIWYARLRNASNTQLGVATIISKTATNVGNTVVLNAAPAVISISTSGVATKLQIDHWSGSVSTNLIEITEEYGLPLNVTAGKDVTINWSSSGILVVS